MFFDRLRLAADVLLHGPIIEDVVPPLQPIGDPWADEELADTRQAAALSLLDEDVKGFVLVRFLDESVGVRCTPDLCHVVQEDWWPTIRDLFSAVK